jgi:hypothetical protein
MQLLRPVESKCSGYDCIALNYNVVKLTVKEKKPPATFPGRLKFFPERVNGNESNYKNLSVFIQCK